MSYIKLVPCPSARRAFHQTYAGRTCQNESKDSKKLRHRTILIAKNPVDQAQIEIQIANPVPLV